MTASRSIEPQRFLSDRETSHLHPRPWHRLAYIARRLPEEIIGLSRLLELREGDRLLDYGCGESTYRASLPAGVDYVGADLVGNPRATVAINPDGTLPLEAETFDAVLSTQVLEHVAEPRTYLEECHRMLRPGGRLLLSTHGIMTYHRDPDDYWRWTGAGLRREIERAGFEVLRMEGIMGLTATGLQLTLDGIHYRLPRPLAAAVALVVQSLIALVDRFESGESLADNALVYAVIGERASSRE